LAEACAYGYIYAIAQKTNHKARHGKHSNSIRAATTQKQAPAATCRYFQLFVAQVVAEFLQGLERPQRKQSLGALDLIEGKLHWAAATVYELQKRSRNGGGLRR
jgi:hypothetical protein